MRNERPDATGLFPDGRFADYRHLTDQWGRPGRHAALARCNNLHSGSMSDDGERFYAAGTHGRHVHPRTPSGSRTTPTRSSSRAASAISARRTCGSTARSAASSTSKKLPARRERLRAPGAQFRSRRARDAGAPSAPTRTSSCATRDSRRDRASASRRRSSRWWACTARCRCRTARRCSRDNPKRRPAWVVITEEWPFGPCPERGLRIVNGRVGDHADDGRRARAVRQHGARTASRSPSRRARRSGR